MSDLQNELSRHLGPVEAPADLWNRIQQTRARRAKRIAGLILWPAVATVLVLSCADLGWEMSRARTVAAAPRLALTNVASLRLTEARHGECLSCHLQ